MNGRRLVAFLCKTAGNLVGLGALGERSNATRYKLFAGLTTNAGYPLFFSSETSLSAPSLLLNAITWTTQAPLEAAFGPFGGGSVFSAAACGFCGGGAGAGGG